MAAEPGDKDRDQGTDRVFLQKCDSCVLATAIAREKAESQSLATLPPPSHSSPPCTLPRLAASPRETAPTSVGLQSRKSATGDLRRYTQQLVPVSHRHINSLSQPTQPPSILAERNWGTSGSTTLYLAAGAVPGFQGLFRGSKPHHPSYSSTGTWGLRQPCPKRRHTSPQGIKGILVPRSREPRGLGDAGGLCATYWEAIEKPLFIDLLKKDYS